MLKCIDEKYSNEYQSLKEKAGIPEYLLETVCRRFITDHNRLPHLDEIPKADSEPFLKKWLGVKASGGVSISKVLEMTGKQNLKEAVIDINDKFRDVEVQMVPIVDEALVEITHKPTDDFKELEPIDLDLHVDNYEVFNNSLKKFANLYGINFISTTEAELNTDKWKQVVPDASAVNAFVYNGNIYINTDRADVDAPLHELFHIFIGSLRFTNKQIYGQLVSSVENLPNYQSLAEQYPGRTRNDVNEEIFVTEMARNLTGLSNSFKSLDNTVMYEINYNLNRMLDIFLMGEQSTKTIPQNQLFTMSLKEIAQKVNSGTMINQSLFAGPQDAEIHRKLNNMKADLYKRGELEELCY